VQEQEEKTDILAIKKDLAYTREKHKKKLAHIHKKMNVRFGYLCFYIHKAQALQGLVNIEA